MNTKCCDSAQLPPQPPPLRPGSPTAGHPAGRQGQPGQGGCGTGLRRDLSGYICPAPQEWGSEPPALGLLRRALRRAGGAESKDESAGGAPFPGPPPLPAGSPTETPADKGVWGEGAASADRSARCYRPVPAARTAARKSGHARAGRGQREGPPARRGLGRAGARGGSGGRRRLPAPLPRLRDLRREGGSAVRASPARAPAAPPARGAPGASRPRNKRAARAEGPGPLGPARGSGPQAPGLQLDHARLRLCVHTGAGRTPRPSTSQPAAARRGGGWRGSRPQRPVPRGAPIHSQGAQAAGPGSPCS